MAPPAHSSGESEAMRERRLKDLRWHWDEAYEIWCDDRFRARRLDGRGCLEAGTARELGDLMLADYSARPVRRHRASELVPEREVPPNPAEMNRSAGDARVSG
jgi:hypothetical protein